LIRREAFEYAGKFAEDLPKGTDSDVFRRIVMLGYDVYFIEKPMVNYYEDREDRITAEDERGIIHSIIGQNYKLQKYPHYLDMFPSQKSRVLHSIAGYYYKLYVMKGNDTNVRTAERFYLQSAIVYPLHYRAWLAWLRLICRRTLRKVYAILPSRLRPVARSSYMLLSRKRLRLMRQRILDRFKLNDLNQIYPEDWFAERKEGVWYGDIQHFCGVIWAQFEPQSVADVGCGPGVYLKCLQQLGAESVLGLEGAKNALKHAVIPNIVQHDLREPFQHSRHYDLVMCIEVAEHIHNIHSDVLVDTIAGLCKRDGHIIFTAAPPGQGGFHHINLQPREFWVKRFAQRGFSYSARLSTKLREQLDLKHLHWIERNLMIFKRRS
jgi:SAM-dependent methyltransferase